MANRRKTKVGQDIIEGLNMAIEQVRSKNSVKLTPEENQERARKAVAKWPEGKEDNMRRWLDGK